MTSPDLSLNQSQEPLNFAANRRRIVKLGAAGGAGFLFGIPSIQKLLAAQETIGSGGNRVPDTDIEREELIVGVQGLPPTIDPNLELSNVGTRVTYTPYDMLIRRDFLNDNENVPSLATEWDQPSDTELVLKLRQGVTFHDGSPFTADDVIFTVERLMNLPDDSELIEAGSYFTSVKSIEKVDDFTVRVVTLAPDPLIIKRFASWGSWIMCKSYIESVGEEEFRRTGMGTGPYKFGSFDPDNELVLERYDGYWGELPPVKKITFRVIPEVAARVTALVNNEVQIITNVPPDQVENLAESDNVNVAEVPLANMHVLVYNTRNPLLADKKLRQALNLGIDRQLIIDAIWGGHAVAKRGHQFEEYGDLFNADRPLTPYDPEAAKQLLAESTYDGAEILYQLQGGYYTNGEQVGQAIVQMWQDIGINVKIQINEKSVTGEDRQIHTWSNSSRLADPDGCLWLLWGQDGPIQASYWDGTDEFNRLGIEARSTLDEQTRYDDYQNMLDIWEDEAPGTVLYDPVEFYGINSSVNWNPYSFYYMDFRAYNLSFNE